MSVRDISADLGKAVFRKNGLSIVEIDFKYRYLIVRSLLGIGVKSDKNYLATSGLVSKHLKVKVCHYKKILESKGVNKGLPWALNLLGLLVFSGSVIFVML